MSIYDKLLHIRGDHMRYDVKTIDEYLKAIPKDRLKSINQLRKTIKKHLPKGFVEVLQYQMISYVIPLKTYPKGYHVTLNTPLSFISIASQKHTINLYHSGIYANKDLHDWFINTYISYFGKKPNMGKSCIRFKEISDKTLALIALLCEKMTVEDMIELYENKDQNTC